MTARPNVIGVVRVPDPGADFGDLFQFAMSFHGYVRVAGDPHQLGQIVAPVRRFWEERGSVPDVGETSARAALFYAAREMRHAGDESDDAELRALAAYLARYRTVLDLSHGAYDGPHDHFLELGSPQAGGIPEAVRAGVDDLLTEDAEPRWAWRAVNGLLADTLADAIGWHLGNLLPSKQVLATKVGRSWSITVTGETDEAVVHVSDGPTANPPEPYLETLPSHLRATDRAEHIVVLAVPVVTSHGEHPQLVPMAAADSFQAPLDLQERLRQRADVTRVQSREDTVLTGSAGVAIHTLTSRPNTNAP